MPSADAVARAENAIVALLIHKAPNWVNGLTLRTHLGQYSEPELDEALTRLAASKRIASSVDPPRYSDFAYYALPSYEGIPVRRFMRVGDAEVPRVGATGTIAMFPEDFNEAVERLAEYTASMENRFSDIIRTQQRDYWATIVTLFSVFVAILALVLVSLPKIQIGPSMNAWQVFKLNLAQVLPVAIVLAIFVLVLRFAVGAGQRQPRAPGSGGILRRLRFR